MLNVKQHVDFSHNKAGCWQPVREPLGDRSFWLISPK